MLLSDYLSEVRLLVHDTSGNQFTDAQLITAINAARNRVALDFHCVRNFFAGLNTINLQETYPLTGGIGGLLPTNPGSGYTSAPTVTIAAPPAGGIQAAAIATVQNGAVATLAMTNWGLGYTSAPAVSFAGGGGTNAAATAQAFINVYDILSVSIIWGAQRIVLNYYPFTMFQAFLRSNATWSMRPGAFTIYEAQKLFYLGPVPNDVYPMEIEALQLPTPLVNTTDNDLQVTLPWNDAVQYFSAYTAMASLQNYEQAEYWQKQYKGRVKEIQFTSFDRRMTNVYRVGRRRFSRS